MSNKQKLYGALILIVVIILAGIYSSQNNTQSNQEKDLLPTREVATSADALISENNDVQGYTMSEVSVHDSPASCYVVINKEVYDVTAWISQHPSGKEAIIQLCGKDGSSLFNGQHSTNAQALAALKRFKVGYLSE